MTRLPDPRNSQAILVASTRYRDDSGFSSLPAVHNNVTALAQIFTSPEYWGLTREHCDLLVDPDEPTTVAAAIANAAATPGDTLLVYLGGHGVVAADGELVVATRNTDPRRPEFTGLRYSWVREALRGSAMRRTVVIIDCCFSGRAITAMSGAEGLPAGQTDIAGAYVLTSTTATRPAIAAEGAQYTVFSGSLVRLLRQGVPGGPRFLKIGDIYERLRKEMIRAGYPQPMQMGTNNVADLSLVRNVRFRAPSEDGHPVGQEPPEEKGTTAHGDAGWAATVALRIAGHDRLSGPDGVDANIALVDAVDTGARRSGGQSSSWHRRPIPGGEVIVLPDTEASAGTVVSMLEFLEEELDALNNRLGQAKRLDLHVVVGETGADDRAGCPGSTEPRPVDVLSVPSMQRLARFRSLTVLFSKSFWRTACHAGIAHRIADVQEVAIEFQDGPRTYFLWRNS